MCQRFIEDFTDKVTQKAICCDFCREKNKKCKIPNSFNYFPRDIYGHIIIDDESRWMFSEKFCIDIILSTLHDDIYYFLINLMNNKGRELKPLITEHLNCVPDEQLIYTDSDWTISTVYRFYNRHCLYRDVVEKLPKDFKQMKFRDWLTELMVR